MVISFRIYSEETGTLITSGANPQLPEEDQVWWAYQRAKDWPCATVHMHPNDADYGLFILRSWNQLKKDEVLQLWQQRKTKHGWE